MLQKLYSILGINDTNKMFSLKELDENNKKQQAITENLLIETASLFGHNKQIFKNQDVQKTNGSIKNK